MKYIVVLTDGLADWPIEELNNKTIMEAANVPYINSITKKSKVGLVKTVPDGYDPGSDTANLSVLGYDPYKYYTGRSPIEAESIGVNLKENEIALRLNFVTLDYKKNYSNSIIIDHGAGEISTKEASILLEKIKDKFENENISFHCGTSYRHLLVLKNLDYDYKLTPPHNILNKEILNFLPKKQNELFLLKMMEESYSILKNNEINLNRIRKGLNPANSIWFWGPGKKLKIPSFKEKFSLRGSIISGVDLIKGIGIAAKMDILDVEGATGTFHTNYLGKANKAINKLSEDKTDFVYLHIEAPDESGHKGDFSEKKLAYEKIDKYVIKSILQHKTKIGPFKMLILPDHPTPVKKQTHTNEPVPFLLYDSTKNYNGPSVFSEKSGKQSGLFVEKGHNLLNLLFSK